MHACHEFLNFSFSLTDIVFHTDFCRTSRGWRKAEVQEEGKRKRRSKRRNKIWGGGGRICRSQEIKLDSSQKAEILSPGMCNKLLLFLKFSRHDKEMMVDNCCISDELRVFLQCRRSSVSLSQSKRCKDLVKWIRNSSWSIIVKSRFGGWNQKVLLWKSLFIKVWRSEESRTSRSATLPFGARLKPRYIYINISTYQTQVDICWHINWTNLGINISTDQTFVRITY